MNFYRHPFRPLATFAAALFVLVACQNATEPVNSSGPVVASGTYTMASSSRLPDSVAWRSPADSGSQKPICSQLTCSDTFRLSKPLGTDSLAVQLWTLGIRTSTIYFGEEGSSPILTLKTAIRRDTLDALLLSKYDTASQKASFSALGQGASSLVAYYAKLILAGDTSFKGKALPVGMNADSVKKDLVYLANKQGLTASQLAAKNLIAGLDSSAIVKAVHILIATKIFSSADSTAIFPPYPVWVKNRIMVNGGVKAGGSPVSVSGTFAWKKDKSAAPKIEFRNAKGVDPNITYAISALPAGADTLWVLDSNLTIQAKPTASVGTDTLVITVSTDSGTAIARVPFQVLARDTIGPSLKITSPSKDTSVPNGTANILVTAIASDSGSGLDYIQIGGTKLSAAPYSKNVDLAVGPDTITVQAWDKAGNSTFASVIVTRAPSPGDTVPPKVVRVHPVQDTIVPWDTKSIQLSWTVSDDSLSKVTLNDSVLVGVSGSTLYQKTVNLSVGIDTFSLLALDKRGNPTRDIVHVTRQADKIRPDVKKGSGTTDTVLLMSQISYSPSWIVTDNALNSVTINEIAATKGSANSYSAPVTLSGDSLWITLVALDSSGNMSRDSFLVHRLFPPAISPMGAALAQSQTANISVVAHDPGDSLEISTDSLHWGAYSGTQLVTGTEVLFARARRGGVISVVVSAVYLYPPAFSPVAGTSASDSLVVGFSTTGVDSIRITQDTTQAWFMAPWVDRNGAPVYARSWLRGTASRLALANYPVFHDTSVVWARIQGRNHLLTGIQSGTTIAFDSIPGLDSVVTLSVGLKGTLAQSTLDGAAVGTWKLADSAGTAVLQVKNGPSQQNYTLRYSKRHSDSITDSRDGQGYKIVRIGTQWWMAQDLITKPIWCGTTLYDYCLDSLYSWAQAMNLPQSCDTSLCPIDTTISYQGVCPAGWHVPTRTEWRTLLHAASLGGADSVGARHLKSKTGWTKAWWDSSGTCGNPDENGDDLFGFGLLGKSSAGFGGACPGSVIVGEWWASGSQTETDGAMFYMTYQAGIKANSNGKNNLFQLRCAKD